MKVHLYGNPAGFVLRRRLVRASRDRIVVRAALCRDEWIFDGDGRPLSCPFPWAQIPADEIKAIHAQIREDGRAQAEASP